MPSKLRMLRLPGILVCLVLTQGCSQFDLRKDIPWPMGSDDDPKVPTKVVAIWNDTVLNQVGRPSKRGFGGRLMFYNNQDEAPVKVDGTLVVYAFDEEGRKPTDVKPNRKYVFTREQLPAHYSKSKIGHSYSVWIPWDEVGGPTKEISLIVRFTPVEGNVVVGEQTKHALGGLPSQPASRTPSQARQAQVRRSRPNPVRPVSYETEPAASRPQDGRPATDGPADPNQQKMVTTTINVPARFGLGTPIAVPRPAPAMVKGAPPDWMALPPPAGRPEPLLRAERARQPAPPRELPRSQTPAQPPARFSPVGPRAPGEPIAPRALDRAPFQPHPAGSLSRPQSPPGWGQSARYGSTYQDASPAPN